MRAKATVANTSVTLATTTQRPSGLSSGGVSLNASLGNGSVSIGSPAQLSLSPSTANAAVGDVFTMDLVANTASGTADTVGAYVDFDRTYLEVVTAGGALAQVQSGRLVGTIYDPNKAAVPKATVTVTNPATNMATSHRAGVTFRGKKLKNCGECVARYTSK